MSEKKYRPLECTDFYAKELYYGKGDGDRIRVFRAEDVKLALQGLIEELKEKKENARAYKIENIDFYEGYEEGLNDSIKAIKRWFADVFERGE